MQRDALGLLEVKGLVVAAEAADAMAKAAHVRVLANLTTRPGLVTLMVAGDIGACQAAISAGRNAALRLGEVLSEKVIGRPGRDLELFLDRPAAKRSAGDPLLAFLASTRSGKRLGQVRAFLGMGEDATRQRLEEGIAAGLWRKSKGRYVVASSAEPAAAAN